MSRPSEIKAEGSFSILVKIIKCNQIYVKKGSKRLSY